MLKSFLLISFRNIKGSGSLLPSILSLTVGMAACVLIYSYVSYQLSFDKFHRDVDRISRLETVQVNQIGEKSKDAYTNYNLGEAILEDQSAVTTLTRLMPFSENRDGFFRITIGEEVVNRVYADNVFYADDQFFEVFSFPLAMGDVESVLSEPNAILISEAHAYKIFGPAWRENEKIIGTLFKSGYTNLNETEFVLKGVFQNLPENSHIQFDALISLSSPKSNISIADSRARENLYTYVKLNTNETLSADDLKKYNRSNSEKIEFSIDIRNITEIHSGEAMANQAELGANKEMISFLFAIGIIILIMVWANYINSSLITSIYRIKEVAIRKLLGVKPVQLTFTFLAESLLINFIGAFLAVFLVIFALRSLEVFDFIDYPVEFAKSSFGKNLLFLLVLCFLSSLVSGIYPALLMSKMQPVESLRGSLQVAQTKHSNKGSKVIRSLLILQLGIVLLFVSALYIVHKQLSYLENNNFSITELKLEGIFPGIIGADDDYNRRFAKLYNDLKSGGYVDEIKLSNLYRGVLKNTYLAVPLSKPDMDTSEIYKGDFQLFIIDYEYFKKDSLKFLAGRNFSPIFSSDYGSVIVNEAAMRAIGYESPEEAIGQLADDVNGFKIISGIIKNEKDDDPPKMYKTGLRFLTYFYLKMQVRGTSGESMQKALNNMERRLRFQFPYFYLLDEQYEELYKSENEVLNFFVVSNIIALLIAGIGLYSLSSFTTLKRNQEIGVRKVLGARVFDILLILYYDFAILMLYGAIISIPLVLWGSTSWLSTYTYKIGIDVTLILIPLLTTVGFILSIVSMRCWRSASRNPVLILSRN